MNRQEKQKRINQCMRLLNSAYRTDINSIRISVHNTLDHEIAKLVEVYRLIKEGKKVITEAIFKDGGRADILIMEDFRVIEILHSETMEEALSKKDYYPKSLDIMYKTSKEILDEVEYNDIRPR